jgi:hypothetical protein
VLSSSNAGSLVSFTGTLNVFVTYPAGKSVNLNESGVVTGYPITVLDSVFTLQDNLDTSKQAQFQLGSITTATTRAYTLPNVDTVLAGLAVSQTFSNTNVFSNGTNTFGSATGTGTNGFSSGATTTGNTKTVNIGTGGLSGSTTAITIGALAGTSTTTMNGQTDIGGTTTSVNFARIVGAATGAAPTISAQGSDANIGLVLSSKGTGVVALGGSTVANSGVQVRPTASSVNYLSYPSNPPQSPDQYSGKQILINSGRLVFNTTLDHILLSSKKSINLNALDSVNIDCNTVIIQSGKLYLGSKNATEPLLLGNSTISTLNNLIDNLSAFLQVCSTVVSTAPGTPLVPLNLAANQLSAQLKVIQGNLEKLKSKSNFTV